MGIVSLPVGAFIFGVLQTTFVLAVNRITGSDAPPDYTPSPFTWGIQLAMLSLVSMLSILLIPLAMLTTLLLRLATVPRNPSPYSRPTIIL